MTTAAMDALHQMFGDPIFAYSRANAIEDGELVDVTDTAREAGFSVPVAMTRAAWEDTVAWGPEDDKRKTGGFTGQDEKGRLWDAVYMAAHRARTHPKGSPATTGTYRFLRVVREGRGTKPRMVTLKIVNGPGDNGEHVVTLMLPDED